MVKVHLSLSLSLSLSLAFAAVHLTNYRSIATTSGMILKKTWSIIQAFPNIAKFGPWVLATMAFSNVKVFLSNVASKVCPSIPTGVLRTNSKHFQVVSPFKSLFKIGSADFTTPARSSMQILFGRSLGTMISAVVG
jgi:hypothetical protein